MSRNRKLIPTSNSAPLPPTRKISRSCRHFLTPENHPKSTSRGVLATIINFTARLFLLDCIITSSRPICAYRPTRNTSTHQHKHLTCKACRRLPPVEYPQSPPRQRFFSSTALIHLLIRFVRVDRPVTLPRVSTSTLPARPVGDSLPLSTLNHHRGDVSPA